MGHTYHTVSAINIVLDYLCRDLFRQTAVSRNRTALCENPWSGSNSPTSVAHKFKADVPQQRVHNDPLRPIRRSHDIPLRNQIVRFSKIAPDPLLPIRHSPINCASPPELSYRT